MHTETAPRGKFSSRQPPPTNARSLFFFSQSSHREKEVKIGKVFPQLKKRGEPNSRLAHLCHFTRIVDALYLFKSYLVIFLCIRKSLSAYMQSFPSANCLARKTLPIITGQLMTSSSWTKAATTSYELLSSLLAFLQWQN